MVSFRNVCSPIEKYAKECATLPKPRIRPMKLWSRSAFIACIVEVPLLAMLANYAQTIDKSTFALALFWYHAVPLSLITFTSLWLFGHGTAAGEPIGVTLKVFGHFWYFFITFVIQVTVTTPVVWIFLKASQHFQKRVLPT